MTLCKKPLNKFITKKKVKEAIQKSRGYYRKGCMDWWEFSEDGDNIDYETLIEKLGLE